MDRSLGSAACCDGTKTASSAEVPAGIGEGMDRDAPVGQYFGQAGIKLLRGQGRPETIDPAVCQHVGESGAVVRAIMGEDDTAQVGCAETAKGRSDQALTDVDAGTGQPAAVDEVVPPAEGEQGCVALADT